MNPDLQRLHPYPFEKLAALKAGLEPPGQLKHIALSIGEPKHPPPDFVVTALADADALARDLAGYPPTRGSAELRTAIATWIGRRFHATADPETQVLPVAGTREALFSIAQAVLSGRRRTATSRAPFDRTLDCGTDAHRALAVERTDGAAAVTPAPSAAAPEPAPTEPA